MSTRCWLWTTTRSRARARRSPRPRRRIVDEPRQGYGHATRRGLSEATGDLIVMAEPDGTFLPGDLPKLLVYSQECDVVFGTRTTRELIWAGANMDWFLRWGNWAVAKLVELLFNTSHLSDVGCTYRLLRRPPAEHVARQMKVGGQPCGRRDHAAHVTSGRPLRRGARQLPAAGGALLRYRRSAHRGKGRPPYDRARSSAFGGRSAPAPTCRRHSAEPEDRGNRARR